MRALGAALALALALALVPPGTALAAESPPLTHTQITEPLAQLEAAVQCDAGVRPDASKPAVLLVHGTGGQADYYWSWNWERALPRAGYGVCTVDLPGHGMVDPVVSAEYVVHAARVASARSGGRKIAIVGHSQGGTLAAWVTKFWPDVAALTDDVVSLSGGFGGTALGNVVCAAGQCAPVAWRASIGSNLMRAARDAPLAAGVSYTALLSLTDEVLFPQPAASTLPGARNVVVQQLCPLRVADHVAMIIDSYSWAAALDAVTHDGPADPARLAGRPGLCVNPFMPDVDWVRAPASLETIAQAVGGLAGLQPWVGAEPPLPDYARADT